MDDETARLWDSPSMALRQALQAVIEAVASAYNLSDHVDGYEMEEVQHALREANKLVHHAGNILAARRGVLM